MINMIMGVIYFAEDKKELIDELNLSNSMLTMISQESYRRLVPSTGGMNLVADDWLGTLTSRNGSLKRSKHSSSLQPRLRLSILSRADLLTRGAFDGRSMLQHHMVTSSEAELSHDGVTAATTTKG